MSRLTQRPDVAAAALIAQRKRWMNLARHVSPVLFRGGVLTQCIREARKCSRGAWQL